MKCYLIYDDTGMITGIATYQQAGLGLHGWPDDYEIDNPNTEHEPTLAWLRNQPTPTGGYLRFDCNCPRTSPQCKCGTVMRMTKFVRNGQLVDKIQTVCFVNDAPVESGTTLNFPPGTELQIRFEFPGADDGDPVEVSQAMQPQILETVEPVVQAQVAGEKVEVTAWAPAQGLSGQLRCWGRICTMMEVRIRGWGV